MSIDAATSLDSLALRLDTLLPPRPGRCLLVAGAPAGERLTTAQLLARALAQHASQRVLALRLAGGGNGGESGDPAAPAVDARLPGLCHLTLRGSAGLEAALAAEGWASGFDTVVLDPVHDLPAGQLDQACLAADGVLLAVAEGSGSLVGLAETCARWRELEVRLLGVIFLARPPAAGWRWWRR